MADWQASQPGYVSTPSDLTDRLNGDSKVRMYHNVVHLSLTMAASNYVHIFKTGKGKDGASYNGLPIRQAVSICLIKLFV
jgi:hypothetical protein